VGTRSFGALFGSSLLTGLALGVSSNLNQIMLLHFWGFGAQQISLMIAFMMVPPTLATYLISTQLI
jgi:hypothetical protein